MPLAKLVKDYLLQSATFLNVVYIIINLQTKASIYRYAY